MIEDWNEAPKWATYKAMDDNGRWYWYEHMPTYVNGTWAKNTLESRHQFAGKTIHLNAESTLEKRP